ncbi:MAG: DUF1549 domain-containing protein [Pirellulales bacterium]
MNSPLSPLRHICVLAGLCVLLTVQTPSAAAEPTGSARIATPHELAAWIDERLANHFVKTGAAQPALVDDATFLRRTYLDLVGTLPKVSEVRDFLDDESDQKRTRLIDRLLADPRFAAHLARTWRRVLVTDSNSAAAFGGQIEQWLTEQLAQNAGFDELTRKLITAGGAEPAADANGEDDADDDQEAPASQQTSAAAYLRSTGGDPASVAGSVSRIFLGVRIECAQCHDHPFTDWKQQDFWGIAAFFAGARYNRPLPVPNNQEQPPTTDERVTSITPPDIGRTYQASFLWDGEAVPQIPEDKLPRQVFADWLTSQENPHFAATAVNRVWQQLCGHGLTESVDDLDRAEEVERALLLDDLAHHFAEHQFDLKWLISGICRSKAYQFAPNTTADGAGQVAARPLKVLSPEQVFDALEVALALPISRLDEGPRFNGQRNEMIARLGETASTSPDKFRAGIPQMLMLMNGVLTGEATSLDKSRTLRAVIDAPFLDDPEKIETLFLATLTRRPSAVEARRLTEHVEKRAAAGERGQAYAEILWALINSPEFVLIR